MARKKYVFVVVLLAIALIVTGVSYAYFTAVATSNEQVVKSGTLELTYHTGKEITRVGMLPTTENNAELHQFSVENVGTLDANYYLYLNNIRLVKDGSPVISNNLKYRLYEADQNYTVQGNPIAIGSFGIESLYESGDTKLLLEENIDLPAKTTKYYVLKIWLQETGSIQNEDQNLEFETEVAVNTNKPDNTVARYIYGIGDSIGAGKLASGESSIYSGGFNDMIKDALEASYQLENYKNQSLSGSTIEQWLDVMINGTIDYGNQVTDMNWLLWDLSQLTTEDILTFAVSANNFAPILSSFTSSSISYEEAVVQINAMLDSVRTLMQETIKRAPNPQIYLIGFHNHLTGVNFGDWPEQIDSLYQVYDNGMQQIASELNINYISGYSLFKGKENIYSPVNWDPHPSEAGYRILANAILEEINEL